MHQIIIMGLSLLFRRASDPPRLRLTGLPIQHPAGRHADAVTLQGDAVSTRGGVGRRSDRVQNMALVRLLRPGSQRDAHTRTRTPKTTARAQSSPSPPSTVLPGRCRRYSTRPQLIETGRPIMNQVRAIPRDRIHARTARKHLPNAGENFGIGKPLMNQLNG